MKNIEIGFIAFKNSDGLYNKKKSICRQVEYGEAISIKEDYLQKWLMALRDWFVELMEVENAEHFENGTDPQGGRPCQNECPATNASTK